ncbi:MAG: hypothetical protein Q7N50_06450, partial [Armatimonadota bacterium]|nr:hypothetical protein [Armatimonadota bacterium]
MTLQIQSDKPGKMEIIRWAIEAPGINKSAKQHANAQKILAHANPLERGMIPHWNYDVGSFVCAYNPTHPENYNFWLEDEGELLWSLGNYPKMMKLYGKGLRDFIVKYSKFGAPVRKVNTQPLAANMFLKDGFYIDTGLLTVDGNLSEDPHVNIHHSVYEAHGLLASLGNFFVSYQKEDGSTAKIDFAKPSISTIEYGAIKQDNSLLIIESNGSAVSAEFVINVYRGRVTVKVNVTNKGKTPLRNVTAGFDLRDCNHYFMKPLNKFAPFGNVAILYADDPLLENCTIVRLAGPAARHVVPQFNKENIIERATASTIISRKLSPGLKASSKLADVNAGSACFADKIEMYKDVDLNNADISMSYVATYALLGLATYSYRYPEDKEAREVTDRMIENFLRVRDRLRDRELAYLLWTLNLLDRDKDANEIADLVEQRAEGHEKIQMLDGAAMGMGLRCVGRWDAADNVTEKIKDVYKWGVAPATEFLGSGALQSPAY